MAALSFKKATKQASKGRVAFIGPAGSGKTFSALAVATRLGKRVAVIDSERGSARKYADLFDFDVLELETFAPGTYVEAIKLAEQEGYEVLVIDSLSHAWMGKEGMLEQVDNAAKKKSGNSFMAWRDVGPQHNALVDAMLGSKCHVIATLRTKTEYVVEEDARGKKVPRKIGLAPVQRDGLEYEFDVTGELTLEHDFIVSKTRCHLMDGRVWSKPGEEFATVLRTWLEAGEPPPEPKPTSSSSKRMGPPTFREGSLWPQAEEWNGKPLAKAPKGVLEEYKAYIESLLGRRLSADKKAEVVAHLAQVQDALRECEAMGDPEPAELPGSFDDGPPRFIAAVQWPGRDEWGDAELAEADFETLMAYRGPALEWLGKCAGGDALWAKGQMRKLNRAIFDANPDADKELADKIHEAHAQVHGEG